MQSVPITTDVVSLNWTHGEVYSPNIQGGRDRMVVGFTCTTPLLLYSIMYNLGKYCRSPYCIENLYRGAKFNKGPVDLAAIM